MVYCLSLISILFIYELIRVVFAKNGWPFSLTAPSNFPNNKIRKYLIIMQKIGVLYRIWLSVDKQLTNCSIMLFVKKCSSLQRVYDNESEPVINFIEQHYAWAAVAAFN